MPIWIVPSLGVAAIVIKAAIEAIEFFKRHREESS